MPKVSEKTQSLVAFITIMVLACFLIYGSTIVWLSDMTVEILGTLIGVSAALTLGNYFRIETEEQKAKRVQERLEKELQRIGFESVIPSDGILYTPSWNSVMNSGSMELLDEDLETAFYAVYREIENHNLTARALRPSALQAADDEEEVKMRDAYLYHYRRLISRSIRKFMARRGRTDFLEKLEGLTKTMADR